MNARIDRLVAKKQHACGAITWITIESVDPPKCVSHVIAAGSMYPGYKGHLENPSGKAFEGALNHVTFRAHEKEIRLLELVAAAQNVVRSLEDRVRDQVGDLNTLGSDLYVAARMHAESPHSLLPDARSGDKGKH
jgi:hypothetical protein